MQSNRTLPSNRCVAIPALPPLRILMNLYAIRARANYELNRDRKHARVNFAATSNEAKPTGRLNVDIPCQV